MTIIIASSRFNNQTWRENCDYREEKKLKGCIYGTPLRLSAKIPLKTLIFVNEMNNSTNKIEGIGLIYNMIQCDKYYKIHSEGNYNRYTYKSDYRIDRSTLYNYNPDIVNALEYILFKEKTHLKRGSGITTVPEKLLKHKVCNNMDMVKELSDIFKRHFTPQQQQQQLKKRN